MRPNSRCTGSRNKGEVLNESNDQQQKEQASTSQMHNRRTDFPRKTAGGRNAMSQVSSSMGSLGHLTLGSVSSQQTLKMNHSKLMKLKNRNNEDDNCMPNGNIQEMIEEEVELEQNEEHSSEDE
jgi:hypothetical protein